MSKLYTEVSVGDRRTVVAIVEPQTLQRPGEKALVINERVKVAVIEQWYGCTVGWKMVNVVTDNMIPYPTRWTRVKAWFRRTFLRTPPPRTKVIKK